MGSKMLAGWIGIAGYPAVIIASLRRSTSRLPTKCSDYGLPVPLIGSLNRACTRHNGSLAQPVRTTFATSRSIASIGARIIVGT